MLKAGIIGLPNTGKSTLFNAVVGAHRAAVASYPFCTIEPNVGGVTVPDERLTQLQAATRAPQAIPAMIEFVDIAGLVKGASKGEGLGNKFLSHIREVDALLEVVRCFPDENVTHVAGALDPVRDIEIVTLELILADLEAVHKRIEKLAKEVKHGDKTAQIETDLLKRIESHLNLGKPANTLSMAREEKAVAQGFFLLTDKPVLYVANVAESDLAAAAQLPMVKAVSDYARTHHDTGTVVICAQTESDLVDLAPEEAAEYLQSLGQSESGIARLTRQAYELLGLRTFFTFNDKEVRAWTIHAGETAPKAAGRIHTDFERGFIKAEVVPWKDLVQSGSMASAREKGRYRIEGKEYVVQDGDVMLFKFHA